MAIFTTKSDPNVTGACVIVFAIFGTIFNCAAIVTFLFSGKLRTKGMYIIIAVISFVQLIHSIFVHPVFANFYLNISLYDFDNCQILFAASVTFIVCRAITVYCLFLLFVNHLIKQRCPNESRERNTGIVGTILICVLSAIVIVPVIATQSTSSCDVFLNYDLHIGMTVLQYLLPIFLLCVAGIKLIISHAVSRQPRVVVVQDGLISQRSSTFPTHILVAAFIAVVTTMPWAIWSLMRIRCSVDVDCNRYILIREIIVMVSQSMPVFMPFSWLLDNEFRQSFKTMLRRKETQTRNTAPVTAYSTLPHEPNQLTYTSL
ncbi:uncharacterized protein LOC126815945 [Patella vulgata]|uniref:uncharacterized protein LOC126815945 n=1 Tax=Patella vulgata TaxID=6465 RepID=UPI0021805C2A|nr:uncharacterized protein LOC126815945 [Patella vulgata]